MLVQFAYEYYALALAIPSRVIVAPGQRARPPTSRRSSPTATGSRVEVRAAARGDKRKLAELATRNARFALEQDLRRHEQARGRRRDALADLQARLDLPAPPVRIECYDISNLGETYAVASMVVFEGGRARQVPLPHVHHAVRRRPRRLRAHARRPSRRRFSRLAPERGRPVVRGAPGPGGDRRRQGPAAAPRSRGCAAAGVEDVPVVSLAKRREEVFRPGRPRPAAARRGLRRRCACCSTSATRPTASRCATTAAGAAAA